MTSSHAHKTARDLLSREPIVIATGNPHKVSEISAVLAEIGRTAQPITDLPGAPFSEPVEDGGTFERNVRLKAAGYAKLTGRVVLADDSGLEVEALGGRPGVDSAYFATEGQDIGHDRETRDRMNNQRLLAELDGIGAERRSASFVCHLVLMSPDGVELASTVGRFPGRIGEPPRVPSGEHGFGYDPLFLVGPGYAETAAELKPVVKNRVSHRAVALKQLAELLQRSGES